MARRTGDPLARARSLLERESRERSAALDAALGIIRSAFPDRGDRLALELEQYAWHAWAARRREIEAGYEGQESPFGRGCSICPRSADVTIGCVLFTRYIARDEGLEDPEYFDTNTRWRAAGEWKSTHREPGFRMCRRCVDTCIELDASARRTLEPANADSVPGPGPDPALAEVLRADLARALSAHAARDAILSWIAALPEPQGPPECVHYHPGEDRGTVRIGPDSWLCARCVEEAKRIVDLVRV